MFSYGHGILETYIPSIQRGRNILRQIAESSGIDINAYSTTREMKINNEESKEIQVYDYFKLYSLLKSNDIIINIEETDAEILFKFNSKKIEDIILYLKPRNNTANRSPFSTKNLPKTKYNIPDEELKAYKDLVVKMDKKDLLKLSIYTNDFIKTLATKRKPIEQIRADMKLKGLKGKEYLHSIGKWNDFVKYLDGRINEQRNSLF